MLMQTRARATVVVLLVSLLAACDKQPANASGPGAGAAAKPIPVTTMVVQPSAWSDSLQAIGNVTARESVTLTSKVSEVVQDVHFESGDEVRAGTPLVTLRGDSQQAALVSAQALYAEAEQLYKRQVSLADQQLVARASLDTQKSIRDAALARVQQMRADIGDRNVRAPFAGVLGLRQVSPGALITPSTVIATLDDVSRVYADFQVPESALASVQAGNQVTGTTVAYPGREFTGNVSTVDARLDPNTRAVTVRADFPNPDRALRPGMLLDVRLFRPERQALVIPEIAVVQVGRESFVYRVKADGSVEQAKVVAGVRRDGKVEILEGLTGGDRIVIEGTGKLRPGVKVADTPPQAAAAGTPARQG
jgi:membrane fusion protein (multidrug efflux system)